MPNKLILEIKNYLKKNNKDTYNFLESSEIFKSLNHILKNKIRKEIYGKILMQINFFKSNFSLEFMKKLFTKSEIVHFNSDEIIYEVNTVIDTK